MALRAYTDGIGESSGDSLAINPSLAMSGHVWYVKSGTGIDAASPAGRERKQPLATLSQAQANASDYDIICLMDGHTEILTAPLTISKRLTIVGGGLSSGKPTVKFQLNASNLNLFNVTGTQVWLRNIWFQAAAQSSNQPTIKVAGFGFRMTGCYMELSGNNPGGGVDLASGGDNAHIDTTYFISTATAVALVPGPALTDSSGFTVLRMRGTTFDGGSVGFSNGLAAVLDGTVSHLHGDDVRLLNGADMDFGQNVGGWMLVSQRTGGARIRWVDSVGGG